MDCETRKDQLMYYAMGQLDGPEQQELCAHLETGCPRCMGRLSEANAILALIPLAQPPATVPASARQRLLDRIGNSQAQHANSDGMRLVSARPRPPRQARGRSFIWPLLAGGAIAAGISAVVFSNLLAIKRQSFEAQLASTQEELRQAHANLENTTQMIRLVSSPAVKVVDLKPMPSQNKDAMARLIWDPQTRAIRLFAADLKKLPPGRAYELWLIDDKHQPHPGGTFTVDETGSGKVDMTMPGTPPPITLTAVTEEPWNDGKGVMLPTSALQLKASVE